MAEIIEFPLQPIDLDRVCLHREEPCTILILPLIGAPWAEPARSWVRRMLEAEREPKRLV